MSAQLLERSAWLLLTATLIGGCAGDEPPRADTRQERRQFQMVMENKMKELDRRFQDFERNVQFDRANERSKQELAEFRRSLDDLDAQVFTLKQAPDHEWRDAKASVDSSYNDLKKRYGALLSRMVLAEPTVAADSSWGAAPDSTHVVPGKPF